MKALKEIRILSLGDLVADVNLSVPSLPIYPEQHQMVESIRFEPGGAGNFLIAGARLGSKIIALGVIGADQYGDEMLQVFQDEGIDTEDVIVQPEGNTTVVFVLSSYQQGYHVFLGYQGNGPEVVLEENWKKKIKQADAVHSYGYTLQEKRMSKALLDGMAFAKECGKPVFFDPGPHVVEIPFSLRMEALRRCNVILLTEDELPLVIPEGRGIVDAHRLLSDSIHTVVVKRGSRGSVAITANEMVEHPGYKVPLVDSTAAGDSYAAAFISAYLQGRPLREVLAIANAMGAAKVRKPGSGRQVPTLKEVRELLAGEVDL